MEGDCFTRRAHPPFVRNDPSPKRFDLGLIPLLDQLRHEPCPTRLVSCASTAAVVSMEVLKKPEVIAKVWVALQLGVIAKGRAPSIFVLHKDTDQAIRQVVRNFFQCQHISGSGRMFDLKIAAVIVMKASQGFYDQIVHGKPDGPAPVGVSAEQRCLRFPWCIGYRKINSIRVECKWILFIDLG